MREELSVLAVPMAEADRRMYVAKQHQHAVSRSRFLDPEIEEQLPLGFSLRTEGAR